MAKSKTVFYCQNCGYEAGKWMGKCPACGEWNTFVEEVVSKHENKRGGVKSNDKTPHAVPLSQAGTEREERIDTRSVEFNRVLGGGLVKGSVTLIGGEPGIGKSTLLLQIALNMKNTKILYVSGEESNHQIKMRADRIGVTNNNCYLLNETFTTNIFKQIEKIKPEILIIDSVQTLYTDTIESSPGSISQIRETAAEMQRFAKSSDVPVFLIGHITKDGNIAGPKVLEHMVDTVLQFEGDRHYGFRILRSVKNRFGSTSELGIFEMYSGGLREVLNPSEILLSQRDETASGVSIAAMLEGQRAMLIETQALVANATYGTPQRSATGFDMRRLNMLLAVLEKRGGFRLGTKDVFLNIAGGIRVDDPAIDLSVVAAVLSSVEDVAVPNNVCFSAEVGLSGEIRAVSRIESRISEAEKLGFEKIVVSKYNLKNLDLKKSNIEIVSVANIPQLLKVVF
jgi:DNA repair protein RadA/Sms